MKRSRWIRRLFALSFAAATLLPAAHTQSRPADPAGLKRMSAQAARVTITRDAWGIAHIHGHTDADAVFGMIYAQCEDDFHRVERNYLTSLGRTAEADGEAAIWQDLRQRLFLDPDVLKADYVRSPAWLQSLMNAWADGINFYLLQHPDVHPEVLTHFEPWMALSFTEGSIGGDIEKIDLTKLQAFYQHDSSDWVSQIPPPSTFSTGSTLKADELTAVSSSLARPGDDPDRDPGGSNGFAIAPSNTVDHHALLLINPHTSFFFRSELQMTSDEGLNAYGAVTWGQFFVYQGFNERAGWMHTSSNVDAIDEFLETHSGGNTLATSHYRSGAKERPFIVHTITLRYKTSTGLRDRTFYAPSTEHGPVTAMAADGRYLTTSLMNKPIEALEQSYLRTKAHTYDEYLKTMALFANSSNNTVFADGDGDIAYWHGNFIPRRDARFDYTHPVDGSDPATAWHGLLTLNEIPHLKDPASGYLFNVNDSPWNGAGASSLKQADYPAYVEQGIESARGVHAQRVLAGHSAFTLDSLLNAAFDSYLPWFARTIPALLAAYDLSPAPSTVRADRDPAIQSLRQWNFRWSADSIPTTLAVFWGAEILKTAAAAARTQKIPSEDYVATQMSPPELLRAFDLALDRLTADFNTWQTPWGQVNRFQRLNGDIQQPFSDAAPSIPVAFTSSLWGSLASFAARPYPGTHRWYGTSGNSFVAVVEFGPRVRARAVTAGGESGHPDSKHFNDEAQRYAHGNLRDVYFYPDELKLHTERIYHPGA